MIELVQSILADPLGFSVLVMLVLIAIIMFMVMYSIYFERITPKDLIRQRNLSRWTMSCVFVLPEDKETEEQSPK